MDQTADYELRTREIRKNAMFKIGTIAAGGDRHLIQIGDRVVTSQRLGGAVALNQTVMMRNDAGQSFFY